MHMRSILVKNDPFHKEEKYSHNKKLVRENELFGLQLTFTLITPKFQVVRSKLFGSFKRNLSIVQFFCRYFGVNKLITLLQTIF